MGRPACWRRASSSRRRARASASRWRVQRPRIQLKRPTKRARDIRRTVCCDTGSQPSERQHSLQLEKEISRALEGRGGRTSSQVSSSRSQSSSSPKA
jgi:hypothetical protein